MSLAVYVSGGVATSFLLRSPNPRMTLTRSSLWRENSEEEGSVETVLKRIRQFRDERDWMKFHDPKNLAMSISIEAAELLELFQWKTGDEATRYATENREAVADEVADVAIYLLEFADNIGIDLATAIHRKLDKNDEKYPVAKARGVATKYDKL
jgi:NTP pyrophosphatase (non-canonical NTP hydrolase)